MITSLVAVGATLCLARYVETHIVDIERDFTNIKNDENLEHFVEEVLHRLKIFKVKVHPRLRLFYQMLKRGVAAYADRTADTIFVPHKYNARTNNQNAT